MKHFWIVLLLAMTGCGTQGPAGQQGAVGDQGPQGSNGHSLVSQTVAAIPGLECAVSGQRLDIYLDADDSLALDAGDTYQSSLIACDGANGLDGAPGVAGAQGPQGDVGPAGAIGADGPQGIAGPTGPQGVQGPQGDAGAVGATGSGATVQNYTLSTSTCASLGDSLYAKKNGSSVRIYNSSSCGSSSQVAEIDSGSTSYWITSTRLGFNVSSGNLRVINYN